MTLASYPTTLPEPTFQGYVIEPVDTILRTDMTSGPARQRQTATHRPTNFQVRWRLSEWDMAVWEGWFFDDAKAGAAYFTMKLLNALGMVDHEVRFKGRGASAFKAVPHPGQYWVVTAVLEARRRPLIAADILALGKTEKIQTLIPALNTLHTLVHVQLPVLMSIEPVGPIFASGSFAEAWEDVSDTSLLYQAVATNRDGTVDGISYSLSNDVDGLFRIDGVTGEVRLNVGKALDRESQASHQFTVRAGDGAYVADLVVTLVVQDRNDRPPVFTSGIQATIADDVDDETVIYTAAVLDPDVTGGPIVFSLTGDANGTFVINSVSGQVTLAPGRQLDAVAVADHHITIQASDQVHATTHDVAIALVDAPNVRLAFDFFADRHQRWTGTGMSDFSDLVSVPGASFVRSKPGEGWVPGPALQVFGLNEPRVGTIDLLTGQPLGIRLDGPITRVGEEPANVFSVWTTGGAGDFAAFPGTFLGLFSDAALVSSTGTVHHGARNHQWPLTAGVEYGWAFLFQAGSSGRVRAGIWNYGIADGFNIRGAIGESIEDLSDPAIGSVEQIRMVNLYDDVWVFFGAYTPAVDGNHHFQIGHDSDQQGDNIVAIGGWHRIGAELTVPNLNNPDSNPEATEPDALVFTGQEALFPAAYPVSVLMRLRIPVLVYGPAIAFQMDDGTEDNKIVLGMTAPGILALEIWSNGVQTVAISGAVTPGEDVTAAVIADAGNSSLTLNGSVVWHATLGDLPAAALGTVWIGQGRAAGTYWGSNLLDAEFTAGAQTLVWAAASTT